MTTTAPEATTDWFRVEAKAGKPRAKVYIYADIGNWEELGDVSARAFAKEVNALDVSEIELHLNSAGGSSWEATAIYNTLRQHQAKVTTYVDGLAASAASLVAMAGDEVIMSTGSQMMIHDAKVAALGVGADQLRTIAGMVDKTNAAMADIYAKHAGGDTADWRKAMTAETWYTAAEAVEAGLADSIDESAEADKTVMASLDDKPFRYHGREAAPQPMAIARKTPAAPADATPDATPVASSEQPEGAGRMTDQAKIREALGLTADASEEEVRNALVAAGLAPAPPDPTASGGVQITDDPERLKAIAASGTTVILDKNVYEEMQAKLQQGVDAAVELRNQKRDALLDAACADGRIPTAGRPNWEAMYDKDPKSTTEIIDGLPRNVVPVSLTGWGGDIEHGDSDEDMGPYAGLWPPAGRKSKAGRN